MFVLLSHQKFDDKSLFKPEAYISVSEGFRISRLYLLHRDMTSLCRWYNLLKKVSRTLNCIWWGGSSSGALGSQEYLFIVITTNFTLTWIGTASKREPSGHPRLWSLTLLYLLIRVPNMGWIDLFKNYLYSIGLCANKNKRKRKQTLQKHQREKMNMNIQMTWFPNLLA